MCFIRNGLNCCHGSWPLKVKVKLFSLERVILFEIPFTQKNLFFHGWGKKSDIASLIIKKKALNAHLNLSNTLCNIHWGRFCLQNLNFGNCNKTTYDTDTPLPANEFTRPTCVTRIDAWLTTSSTVMSQSIMNILPAGQRFHTPIGFVHLPIWGDFPISTCKVRNDLVKSHSRDHIDSDRALYCLLRVIS